MEAQKLITMSINKIAGSRRQRGGINLRKNLLVASVLHSARLHYYEEMCNRMPGHITLEQSNPESNMDEDCTESPDWDSDEDTHSENAEAEQECEAENNETAGNLAVVSESSCASSHASDAVLDKENVAPVQSHCRESSENAKLDSSSCHSTERERSVLSSVTVQSQNSAVETCTTTTCVTVPSVKRKRTETEEACEAIIPKRAKVDSQCQTVSSDSGAHSSISSLVDIFKAGFHGLAGESGKLTNVEEKRKSSSEIIDSTPSYTPLVSRPFEALQTAVIAAC